jgi:hypothetical protein
MSGGAVGLSWVCGVAFVLRGFGVFQNFAVKLTVKLARVGSFGNSRGVGTTASERSVKQAQCRQQRLGAPQP